MIHSLELAQRRTLLRGARRLDGGPLARGNIMARAVNDRRIRGRRRIALCGRSEVSDRMVKATIANDSRSGLRIGDRWDDPQ